jgi:hypothetical protein
MGTMRIELVSIFVDDQDQAEQFYTQVSASRSRPAPPYSPASAG